VGRPPSRRHLKRGAEEKGHKGTPFLPKGKRKEGGPLGGKTLPTFHLKDEAHKVAVRFGGIPYLWGVLKKMYWVGKITKRGGGKGKSTIPCPAKGGENRRREKGRLQVWGGGGT